MGRRIHPLLPLSKARARCFDTAKYINNGFLTSRQANRVKSALNTLKNDPPPGCRSKRHRYIRYQEMLRRCRCVESFILCALGVPLNTTIQMGPGAVLLPTEIEMQLGCLSDAFRALAENYRPEFESFLVKNLPCGGSVLEQSPQSHKAIGPGAMNGGLMEEPKQIQLDRHNIVQASEAQPSMVVEMSESDSLAGQAYSLTLKHVLRLIQEGHVDENVILTEPSNSEMKPFMTISISKEVCGLLKKQGERVL
ncbi:hypothetical protein BDV97DRAFT_147442 [Delphinella strobiligena]|nr:hypothetical protein BDV97DRAFT_147442 [Delphinella strobiligena]